MKILIGLLMAVIGIPLTWWAFNKAVEGEDFYNWVWVPAMFLAIFGILTVIAQLVRWMKS
jgi:hypothetical protein